MWAGLGAPASLWTSAGVCCMGAMWRTAACGGALLHVVRTHWQCLSSLLLNALAQLPQHLDLTQLLWAELVPQDARRLGHARVCSYDLHTAGRGVARQAWHGTSSGHTPTHGGREIGA
jgi:hypothetical protein